jgi:diguanylate cyclase (GGDEF)-like protein
MRPILGRRAVLVAMLLFALFIAVAAYFVEARSIAHAEMQDDRIVQQLSRLRSLVSDLQEAESSQRGYLLMGEDAYLDSYRRVRADIDGHFGELVKVFTGNAPVLSKLARIDTLKNEKLAALTETIRVRRASGAQAAIALMRTGEAHAKLDETRAIIEETAAELHVERERIARELAQRSQISHYLLFGIGVLLVGAIGYVIAQLMRSSSVNANLARRLEVEATHDPLTGLPNRRLLIEWLDKALAQAERTGGNIGVFFIDLDGFKQVNDRLGHTAGDLVLRQTAERFKKVLRNADILARFGGDEFAVVVQNAKSPNELSRVAQRLMDGLSDPLLDDLPSDVVGASIGVAVYPEHGKTLDTLLAAADSAMYRAKQAGKRQYRFAPS